jgi:hypothetical protein
LPISALIGEFGAKLASIFNDLQLNSLRSKTGNYFYGTGNFGAGTGNFTCQNRNYRWTKFSVRAGSLN